MTLDAHWDRTWEELGLAAPDPELLADLRRRYSAPKRAYHTLQHLSECLDLLDDVVDVAERPGEVRIALLYHDAVYDFLITPNEERSADLACDVLFGAGAAQDVYERVRELVMATCHDAEPATPDACLVADIDLAILGAEPERFREYETQIRREWSFVPEPTFREARGRTLQRFIDRPFIFRTAALRARLEDRARANLAESVRRLRTPSVPL